MAESPTAAASDRLVRKGIVVVAAACNGGFAGGTYHTGEPSTVKNVISVAGHDNLTVKSSSFTVSPDNMRFGYVEALGDVPAPPNVRHICDGPDRHDNDAERRLFSARRQFQRPGRPHPPWRVHVLHQGL